MVKGVTKMVNSLPRKGGVHAVQSPRMLVMGIGLHTPITKYGQYVQGYVGGPNNTNKDVTKIFHHTWQHKIVVHCNYKIFHWIIVKYFIFFTSR